MVAAADGGHACTPSTYPNGVVEVLQDVAVVLHDVYLHGPHLPGRLRWLGGGWKTRPLPAARLGGAHLSLGAGPFLLIGRRYRI